MGEEVHRLRLAHRFPPRFSNWVGVDAQFFQLYSMDINYEGTSETGQHTRLFYLCISFLPATPHFDHIDTINSFFPSIFVKKCQAVDSFFYCLNMSTFSADWSWLCFTHNNYRAVCSFVIFCRFISRAKKVRAFWIFPFHSRNLKTGCVLPDFH